MFHKVYLPDDTYHVSRQLYYFLLTDLIDLFSALVISLTQCEISLYFNEAAIYHKKAVKATWTAKVFFL